MEMAALQNNEDYMKGANHQCAFGSKNGIWSSKSS
jgi:hypothetical protein